MNSPMREAVIRQLMYHLRHREGSACGRGLDEYARNEVLEHPMAYAMYCRGMLALASATGDSGVRGSAIAAGSRLLDLSTGMEARSWGLPFEWRDRPANHPYAITTALAALALTALAREEGDWVWVAAAAQASRWLTEELPWSQVDSGSAPWYAPGEQVLAYNVASTVAAALAEAFELQQEPRLLDRMWSAMRYVLAGQHPSGGWRYATEAEAETEGHSESGSVVDLVHSAYTLDGLIAGLATSQRSGVPIPEGVPEAIAVGVEFIDRYLLAPDGLAHEKVVIVESPDDEAVRLLFMENVDRAPMAGGGWIVTFPAESRAWGYGAAAGALSRALRMGFPGARDPLDAIMNRVTSAFLQDSLGRFPFRPDELAHFPRHESHLFDGMAGYALTAMPYGQAATSMTVASNADLDRAE
jgi:hypothetical protein